MFRKSAFIGCLLCLAAPGAYAQSDYMQLRADTGFYMGLAVGRSETRDFCTTIGGACDAKDVTYGVFGGYQINRNFGVEIGFHDLGEARTSGFCAGIACVASSETKIFELVGTAGVPFTDNFSVYLKAGIFRFDTDLTFTGFPDSNDKGTKGTFGIGAQYKIGRQFAARVEWQRYLSVTTGVIGAGSPDGDVGVWRASGLFRF